jgi:hypothetical protein
MQQQAALDSTGFTETSKDSSRPSHKATACQATPFRLTEITSTGNRRDIRAAARTGLVRFLFPGTRRFCLRNSG